MAIVVFEPAGRAESAADELEVFELSREALDRLPFGVITLDRQGTVLRYNAKEAAIARRTPDRTIGLNFFADVAPCTNVQGFKGRFDAFAQSPDSGVDRFDFSFAFRWGRHDVSITLLRKAEQDEINVLVRGRSMAVLDALTLDTPSAPQGTDREAAAPAAPAAILQTPVTWPYGTPAEAAWRERVHPDDALAASDTIDRARAKREPYAVEYRAFDAGQQSRVYIEQGAPAGGGGSASALDVTARRAEVETLRRAAHYDELTGLINRNLLLRRIGEAVREAASGGRIAAILSVDLDDFRTAADTFGAAVGDALLRAIALRLGESVRGGDSVARLGADRFAVLLTDLDDLPGVEFVVRRVLSSVSRPVEISGRRHYLTASIGASVAPYHGEDPELLLRAADSAMVVAKRGAGGAFQVFTREMATNAAENIRIEEELRRAIDRGELEAYYQPIVDLVENRVRGAEALVRWNHPQRGLVMPGAFITIAEQTGLVGAIGDVLLREACLQLVRWTAQGADLHVGVNVSAIQLRQNNFPDTVRAILEETGAPPGRIELEVTESMMIEGFEEVMGVLTELKLMGLRLSLDDFGTGYSSLAHLKYLPIDTLKLDRAFVADITVDVFDRSISSAVIALARDLKLECIAEGIETVEQMQLLRELGCRYMQGYLFGRPRPAADFPLSTELTRLYSAP